MPDGLLLPGDAFQAAIASKRDEEYFQIITVDHLRANT